MIKYKVSTIEKYFVQCDISDGIVVSYIQRLKIELGYFMIKLRNCCKLKSVCNEYICHSNFIFISIKYYYSTPLGFLHV